MLLLLIFSSEGEQDKFTYIYDHYRLLMLRKADAILHSPNLAEDAVSEALIRIYRNLHKISDPASNSAIAFVVTISKNCALTLLQQERRYQPEPELETADYGDNLEQTVVSGLSEQDIYLLTNQLSEELRSVFVLKYAYDYSHREIGQLLGINENNVTVRLHRAKKKLAQLLTEGGGMRMRPDEQESLFRHLAEQYTKQYGANLREELEQLPPAPETPRLDRKLKRGQQTHKRMRWLPGLVAAVACLALVLLIPSLLDRTPPSDSDPSSDTPSSIILASLLPPNLSLTNTEQDQGYTIYYLDDQYQDDVVLTLAKAEGAPTTEGMHPIDLDGQVAYGIATADYSLLTFDQDGLRYELTCRYDLNTLLDLGAALVSGS